MREALRSESSRGITLQGVTFGQKLFSSTVAGVITVLLVVIPSLFSV
ncbi:MAG: hypothetical protein FWF91_02230 [Coriobacteriia bacterium]|jgi:hypothetical protein|nr:hypothetical protein [Coriobacteriia bacterium]